MDYHNQYFIEFEKTARKMLPEKTLDELTFEVMGKLRQRMLEQEQVIGQQRTIIDEQAPKVEAI